LGEGESGKGTGHLAFSAVSQRDSGRQSFRVTGIVGFPVAKVGALWERQAQGRS